MHTKQSGLSIIVPLACEDAGEPCIHTVLLESSVTVGVFEKLIRKAPNTTISEFANTVESDETAHKYEQSQLGLQRLSSSL